MAEIQSVPIFFGEPWGALISDAHARRVDTPIGGRCHFCTEDIVEGDRGFVRGALTGGCVGWGWKTVLAHAECEALTTVGHIFGVCGCTGYGNSRASARVLWKRLSDLAYGNG